MESNKINFESAVVNSELAIKMTEYKYLADLVANSMIYYYQTKYSDKSYTMEEYTLIYEKYQKLKSIVDSTLGDFYDDLNVNLISSDA